MGSNTTGGEAGGLGEDKRRPRGGPKTMAGTAPERLRPGAACAGCQRGCGGAPGSGPGRLRERFEGLSEVKICPRSRKIAPPCRQMQLSNGDERVFSRGRRMCCDVGYLGKGGVKRNQHKHTFKHENCGVEKHDLNMGLNVLLNRWPLGHFNATRLLPACEVLRARGVSHVSRPRLTNLR